MDDYREAAMRWLQDGDCLLRSNRFGGASHAFGLAAECAVKHAMDRLPGGERELPRRHLPDLIDDGKRWFSGRTQRGLYQLLNSTGYEAEVQPDVVLIDSRAGLHETVAAPLMTRRPKNNCLQRWTLT